MKKYLSIHKNKLIVLADQVLVSASAFVTNILLARALGVDGYGIFSMIGLIQFFCLSISMGITSQVYQVVQPSLSDEDKNCYTTGLFYILSILLTALLLIGLTTYILLPAHWHIAKTLAISTIITTCLFLLQDFIRKVLLTQQLHAKALMIDAITNLLQLLFLGYYWLFASLNVQLALWIIGLTFIPSIILGCKWLTVGLPNKNNLKFAWKVQQSRTGWMLMSNLLQWGTGYFFVIAAGWWVGPAALGALRLAQYIFGLLNVILQAIENYALPKAAALKDNNVAYLKKLLQKMLLFMLPILLMLCIFSKQVLTIAGGAAYAAYDYVIYGLSIIYLLITIGYPVRIAIRSREFNKQYFIGYLWSISFTTISAYWLLSNWQLMGVLTGLFIIQCITVGYWFSVLLQKKVLSWKSFTLF